MSIKSILKNVFFDKGFDEDVKFLKSVTLFSNVPNKAIREILGIVNKRKYEAGEVVFNEGVIGKILYLIKSGEVAGVKNDKELFRLHHEDYFGEMALIDETTRSLTVKAATDCELYLIYKVKFEGFLEDDPKMGNKILLNLAKVFSNRLRQSNCRNGNQDL